MTGKIIIGVSGKKRHGKDAVASLIADDSVDFVQRIAFADALKKEVAEACGVSLEEIESKKELYRPILQWWGTEFRRGQDKNYWLKQWALSVSRSDAEVIIVPDVRFENEAEIVKASGGQVWRVVRPGLPEGDNHASETAMDNYHFDTVIQNDGTLEDLKRSVSVLWDEVSSELWHH